MPKKGVVPKALKAHQFKKKAGAAKPMPAGLAKKLGRHSGTRKK